MGGNSLKTYLLGATPKGPQECLCTDRPTVRSGDCKRYNSGSEEYLCADRPIVQSGDFKRHNSDSELKYNYMK